MMLYIIAWPLLVLGICALEDSRLNESDFKNRNGYGYIRSRLGKDVSGTSKIRDICYSRLGEHISGTCKIRDICSSRLVENVSGTCKIRDICYSRLGEHISGLEHLNKRNGMRCSICEAETFGELQGHILTLGNVFKIKREISWSSC
jgi:hypothetical protein